MKKVLAVMLAVLLCLGVVACGGEENGGAAKDGVSLNKSEITVEVGRSVTVTAALGENYKYSVDDDGKNKAVVYTFASADTSVATVKQGSKLTPETATIKGEKVGTTTVTVTTDSGKTASVSVTVVARAQLTASSVTVMQTETAAFPADNLSGFTFTIGDSSIATIDAATGAITGVAIGTTTARATKGDRNLTISVNVIKFDLPVTTKHMNVFKTDRTATFPLANLSGVTLASEDTSVATVEQNGTITLNKAGRTNLTASKNGITTTVELCVLGVQTNKYTFGDQDETKDMVNLYGRTNYDSPKGRMFYFTSSGFDVTFYGTTLTGDFTSVRNGEYVPWLSVFVDGESMTEKSVTAKDRILKLEKNGSYTIVSGLTEGWHTVKVRKRTAFQRGGIEMDSFGINCITASGSSNNCIGYAPSKSDFRIDVYGDSISCGYGNLTNGGSMESANTDGVMAYHSIFANTLGADLNVMACSGWGAAYGYREGAAPANEDHVWCDYYTKLNTKSNVEYGAGGADMIIINLGTNDAGNKKQVTKFANAFKTKYMDWIKKLSDANPGKPIVCSYGMMGIDDTIRVGIENAVNELKTSDSTKYGNIYAYFYTHSASGAHPVVEIHKQCANELLTFVRTNNLVPAEM